jgi:hypothetical protein
VKGVKGRGVLRNWKLQFGEGQGAGRYSAQHVFQQVGGISVQARGVGNEGWRIMRREELHFNDVACWGEF